MNNFAYTTVVTKTKYEACAGRLYQALKYFKSKYPMEILVSDNLSEEDLPFLTKNNIPYKKIKPLIFDSKNSRYPNTFSKVLPWLLTSYDYLCFIDADIILTKNIDYVFEQIDTTKLINYWVTWVEEKQRVHICGGTFYFKPGVDIYNYLITLNNKVPNINTDDELFYLAFFNSNQDNIIAQTTPKNELEYIHSNGQIKIWELFNEEYNILYSWFYKLPIEDFYAIMYKNNLNISLDNLIEQYRQLKVGLRKVNNNLIVDKDRFL